MDKLLRFTKLLSTLSIAEFLFVVANSYQNDEFICQFTKLLFVSFHDAASSDQQRDIVEFAETLAQTIQQYIDCCEQIQNVKMQSFATKMLLCKDDRRIERMQELQIELDSLEGIFMQFRYVLCINNTTFRSNKSSTFGSNKSSSIAL